MKNLLVVPRPKLWPSSTEVDVVAAKDYLCDPAFARKDPSRRIINLPSSSGYQSLGYYVSLLADARRHRVMPTAAVTQDIKNRSYLDAIDDEIPQTLKRDLPDGREAITFRVELGETDDPTAAAVADRLFRLLQIPLFEATYRRRDGELGLTRIVLLPESELEEIDRRRIIDRVVGFLKRRMRPVRPRTHRFDLAILRSEAETHDQPSDTGALERFLEAAESLAIHPEIIHRDDYARLREFDGLFIRETTRVNGHSYRFARRAQAEGIVVIDDPESILRCSNKVFLAELFRNHRVPHPPTWIITKDNVAAVAERATYPIVVKKPDGTFSVGSHRAHSAHDFERRARDLLERSELVLAQIFLPSSFDWRIGIIDGQPLFACRYYMAKGHWQIIRRDGERVYDGDHETVPLSTVPALVLETALAAARLIGDGLYGVDLKEIDGKAFVIEVNDNPNIDADVEDQVLGSQLYRHIMEVFLKRMERTKAAREAAT